MFCKKCGNKLLSDITLCSKCGDNIIHDLKFNLSHHVASRSVRLTNYILDYCIMSILLVAAITTWTLIEGGTDNSFIGFFIIGFLFLYYILFEYFFQKTPAKWVTKTQVVNLDGSKPGFWKLVGRNVTRWIPLGPIMFLYSEYPREWHDRVSNTMVVPDSYTRQDIRSTNTKSSGSISLESRIFCIILTLVYIITLIGKIVSS